MISDMKAGTRFSDLASSGGSRRSCWGAEGGLGCRWYQSRFRGSESPQNLQNGYMTLCMADRKGIRESFLLLDLFSLTFRNIFWPSYRGDRRLPCLLGMQGWVDRLLVYVPDCGGNSVPWQCGSWVQCSWRQRHNAISCRRRGLVFLLCKLLLVFCLPCLKSGYLEENFSAFSAFPSFVS